MKNEEKNEKNPESWEKNLTDGFNRFGIYHLKDMNDNLYKWVGEWVRKVGSFDGMGLKMPEFDYAKNIILVEVKMKDYEAPFKAEIIYEIIDNEVVLKVKSIKRYYWPYSEDLLNVGLLETEWVEKSKTGLENRNKDIAIDLLNDQILKFVEWLALKKAHAQSQIKGNGVRDSKGVFGLFKRKLRNLSRPKVTMPGVYLQHPQKI